MKTRKRMNEMTKQELVNFAIDENFTLGMVERYNVNTELLIETIKEMKQDNLKLELVDCISYTSLIINGVTQTNNGCTRSKNFGFVSANVYRNKKRPEWFDCRFSQSETPTNEMTEQELKYFEFVGIARK